MTIELGLRRFSLLPSFAQLGGDEPPPSGMKRKIHWVGKKEAVEQGQDTGRKGSGESPKKKDARGGYRNLSNITLGEVSDVHNHYAKQLAPSPFPVWLARNYFCLIHLKPKREPRPPAIFGRVKVCYPGDGYAQNVQELELLFPGKGHAPEPIHLNDSDILLTPDQPLQSFCVRVRCLLTLEDFADFSAHEELFLREGFLPEFNTNYIDLLDINEHNHAALPWMYVISSRWFASIPVSIQPEIREKLTKLIQWNKLIFNYHPELMLPREVHSLNRELGFKPGYTDIFLIEPEDPLQTIQIVSRAFDKIFNQPIK